MSMVPRCRRCDAKLDPYGRDQAGLCPSCNVDPDRQLEDKLERQRLAVPD